MERAHVATIHGLVDKREDCCSCDERAVFEIDTHGEYLEPLTVPACLAHARGFLTLAAEHGRLAIPDSP